MNHEIISEEFEHKEGLNKGNKSFWEDHKIAHQQSRRWEGVFYLVWFAFLCPSSLTLGMFPEEQDFSLKIASVLSFTGLTVTGTVDFCL